MGSDNFIDPELEAIEGSEIQAVVDVSLHGVDDIFRPVYINQDQELLHLTIDDAKRLHQFLGEAIDFLTEYSKRIIQ